MQRDPIGIVKHFEAWKEFAYSADRNFPIIFANLNKMTSKSSLSLLTNFLKVTSLGDVDFTYKPKKRKQADILQVIIITLAFKIFLSTSLCKDYFKSISNEFIFVS